MNSTNRIQLGAMVRDELSGLEGKVVAITDWLHGCQRISIQPIGNKDGKPYETFSVDEPQVVVLSESEAEPAAPRHGDRADVGRREDVARR